MKREGSSALQIPLLQVGNEFVDAEPIHRGFQVKNNGSSWVRVSWSVRNPNRIVNGAIKFKLAFRNSVDLHDESGDHRNHRFLFKSSIQFWDDISENVPFRVEPDECTLKPYGQFQFKAIQNFMSECGDHNALAICSILDTANLNDNLSMSKKEHVSAKSIQLFLKSALYYPALRINDKLISTDSLEKNDDDDFKIQIIMPITVLFGSHLFAENHHKMVVIENPTMLPIVFNVEVDGPFQLGGIANDDNTKTSNSCFSLHAIELCPQEKKNMSLSIILNDELRNTQKQGVGSHEVMGGLGCLNIHFSSGHKLQIPLKATFSTPFISTSVSKLNFGCCHVRKSCVGSIVLHNPTNVLAKWDVGHVSEAGGAYRSTQIKISSYQDKVAAVDDPSVFKVSPKSGEFEGPTIKNVNGNFSCPFDILIEFSPQSNVRYSSRLKFVCQYGNTFEVLLEGEGTFEEHEHKPISPTSFY